MPRFAATAFAVLLALAAASPDALGQEPPPEPAPTDAAPTEPADRGEPTTQPGETPPDGTSQPTDPVVPSEPDPEQQTPPPALPADPRERLAAAREAFQRTEFALLVPLLQPLDEQPTLLGSVAERVAARELLGVGYFFLAQQTPNAEARADLTAKAKDVFLRLLRERPEHVLDQLVFPASVVELFEQVRRENAVELEALLASRDSGPTGADLQTLYIERATTQRVWWLNLMPFGIGQFQNGDYAKGTAFALLQAGSLVFNVASYWVIVLQFQDPVTGLFEHDAGDQSSNYANALRWRRNLYIGLGSFVGVWAVSIVDALVNYELESVRIRTLDAPPPELQNDPGAQSGLESGLPLGLSLEIRW